MTRRGDHPSEQRRRRFVPARMLNPYALPVLGSALVVAVVGGIQLGNSAIAGIDPVHFQGPAVHPRDRGAVVPEPPPAEGLSRRLPTSYDQLYGWDEGQAARAAVCMGCEGAPVYAQAYVATVPYFGSREEARHEDARDSAAIDELYEKRLEAMAMRQARADLIARYAAGSAAEADADAMEPVAPEEAAVPAEPVSAIDDPDLAGGRSGEPPRPLYAPAFH